MSAFPARPASEPVTAKSEKISPTAYATGYLWYRLGLSDVRLTTPQGRRLDRAFRSLGRITQALGGLSLDAMMQARHTGIDAQLSRAIDDGRVSQVIELAAGLSARGWRYKQRYGERLTYIETDLPVMVAEKRRLLSTCGDTETIPRVVELDVLKDSGPDSLSGIAATLNPAKGLAIITEGLMNYLAPGPAEQVWRRIAATLRTFPHGVYLSDFYLRRDSSGSLALLLFGKILQLFVRGRLHVHFITPEQAVSELKAYGYSSVSLHAPGDIPETREIAAVRGADRVRVLEATT